MTDAILQELENTFKIEASLPLSDAIQSIEHAISGAQLDRIRSMTAGAVETGTPRPVPSDIAAAMQLCEVICRSDGDVWQTVTAPIDVGRKPLIISTRDVGVRKAIRELFDLLKIEETVDTLLLTLGVYGNAFPVALFDGKTPAGILHLYPPNVSVGEVKTVGQRNMGLLTSEELLMELQQEHAYPRAFYQALADDYATRIVQKAQIIPLKTELVRHLSQRKFPWERYAFPPIARAIRAISTRWVLEEMSRGLIEGIKGQFWLFTLSNPQAGEITLLTQKLRGATGDRTGYLVWRDNIKVQQFVPATIDSLMATEKWLELTFHIFRQLGISVRIISGETPGRGSTGRGDAEMDARILIERLDYLRGQITNWLNWWVTLYTQRAGSPALRKAQPRIRLAPISLRAADLIKEQIAPLLGFGGLSWRTALEEVGYDPDVELENLKEELETAYLRTPKASFAQQTVLPGGRVQTNSQSFPGRTPDDQVPQATRRAMQGHLLRALREAEAVQDAQALAALGRILCTEACQSGYQTVNAAQTCAIDRVERAVQVAREWLTQAGPQALRTAVQLAWTIGLWQALTELGMTGWQRSLSNCEACDADRTIHPFTLNWYPLHAETHPERVNVYHGSKLACIFELGVDQC